MKLKNKLRSATELTVSMTIIATLLAGCLGGGGGGAAPATGTTFSVTPALGKFKDGAKVDIRDSKGNLCNSGTTLNGTATLTIQNTCTGPFVVQAGTGANDQYFDEKTGGLVGTSGVGINAVLPDTTRTSFGVTALTHIAAGALLDASGVLKTGTLKADVDSRNNTIAALLSNGNVTDPLAVPLAAASGVQAGDAYGALLATLANLVTAGNARQVAQDLADDLADGVWDGFAGGVATSTPSAANFGATMSLAAASAVGSINAASAPTLSFASYVPAVNVASAVTAAAANGGVLPITTAKNLFTSLRTSLKLLSNPSRDGFFDTEMLAAKNDLRNAVVPQINKTMSKIGVMNHSINLMNNLKANGITGLQPCNTGMGFGTCKMPDLANNLNTIVQSVSYNGKNGALSTCTTNSQLTTSFGGGTLPAGINVSCKVEIDQRTFAANGSTSYMFNSTVTPAVTANDYTYTSSTTTTPYTYGGMGSTAGTPTNSANYTGTATVVKNAAGTLNSSVIVSGQLAADGVSHAYNQVAINMARTYTTTVPAGAPTGYALAKYDVTGSIASHQTTGAALGTIALLTGSSFSHLEDSNGTNFALTAAQLNAGQTLTAVLQAKTVNTQIDGTATAGNFACDLSGFYCGPASVSLTGSITNLANAAVGKFFTGTLTDTRDFTSYDTSKLANSTLVATGLQNRIKDTGTFSGTVTNNTVTPAAVYQITFNEDRMTDGQNTVSFIYMDPSKNTVTVNAVVLANTSTHTFNVTSGAVIGVLSRTPTTRGITSGLTGNLYVGGTVTAPGTQIGTLNGATVNYTDGSFTTLQ